MGLGKKCLRFVQHVFSFFFFYFSLSSSAKADWINLSGAENAPTIAEIYILDNHVRLVLEIYIGDIPTFNDLLPDAFLKETVNRLSLAERLKRFSSETFRFLTPDGMPLQAELQVIEPQRGAGQDRQAW